MAITCLAQNFRSMLRNPLEAKPRFAHQFLLALLTQKSTKISLSCASPPQSLKACYGSAVPHDMEYLSIVDLYTWIYLIPHFAHGNDPEDMHIIIYLALIMTF